MLSLHLSAHAIWHRLQVQDSLYAYLPPLLRAADHAAGLLPLLLLVPDAAAATRSVAHALNFVSAAEVDVALLHPGAAVSALPVDLLPCDCQLSAPAVALLLHSSCQQ